MEEIFTVFKRLRSVGCRFVFFCVFLCFFFKFFYFNHTYSLLSVLFSRGLGGDQMILTLSVMPCLRGLTNPLINEPAYESKWMKNLKKDSLQKARRFSHTFRFIDDLLTINDNNLFLQNFKDIYPPELQLNLESSGDHVTFLDLDLTLVYGHLDVKLFDKRDSFPFAIVRLPFLSSNIPTTMFYSSIGAEILRIGRVSSSFENFLLSASILLDRARKQGADVDRLSKTLKKTYGRQQVLRMFRGNATEFVNRLLIQ